MAHTFPADAIRFYTTKDENGYMSNFSRYNVECFGDTWKTSEHAYQAQKFVGMNVDDYKAVLAAATPKDAAALGRDPNRPIRKDWNEVRDDVMRFIVMHKFLQNKKIHDKLLATGNRALYEYDTHRGDTYWAIDSQGVGKNMLGLILMEVREVLKENILEAEHLKNEIKNCEGCQTEHYDCVDHRNVTKPSDIYLTSLLF